MIKLVTKVPVARKILPMCELTQGQVAFVPEGKVYVIAHKKTFLILDNTSQHPEDLEIIGFDSWGPDCKIEVELLPPGETITVEFGN